jgi:methionyl-tRNA formyltransferase
LDDLAGATKHDLQQLAPLVGAVNSCAHALQRLESLPEIKIVAEAFYTKPISQQVLERVQVINIHPAPLPGYRGAHPLQWQIIRGESESAESFHLTEREIDAGPILRQVPFAIAAADNYGAVLDKVLRIIRRHAGCIFDRFARGHLTAAAQDHSRATYVVKRAPHDGWIDWSASARDVRNFVRALTAPLPGACSIWNGEKVILDAVDVDERLSRYDGRTPGQIAPLPGVCGVLTGDSGVIARCVRRADTGEDITRELRVNDRFTRP